MSVISETWCTRLQQWVFKLPCSCCEQGQAQQVCVKPCCWELCQPGTLRSSVQTLPGSLLTGRPSGPLWPFAPLMPLGPGVGFWNENKNKIHKSVSVRMQHLPLQMSAEPCLTTKILPEIAVPNQTSKDLGGSGWTLGKSPSTGQWCSTGATIGAIQKHRKPCRDDIHLNLTDLEVWQS